LHPGLTLTFLIQIGTLCYYWAVSAFGVSVSYEAFVTKNLTILAFFAKVLVTLMYFVSFVLLFLVSLKLLEKRRYALIAVVGYATTFNVLLFHNLVNVDPFVVSYTLLAFLFLWKYSDEVRNGNMFFGGGYIALSATTAVLAFYEKFALCWPILLLFPFYVLFDNRVRSDGNRIQFKVKLLASSAFVFISTCLLFLIGTIMDWQRFVSTYFWGHGLWLVKPALGTQSSLNYDPRDQVVSNIYAKLSIFIREAIEIILQRVESSFLNWTTWTKVFAMAESIFLGIALVGFFLVWNKLPEKRRYLAQIGIFIGVVTIVAVYRGGYHYCFFHLAFAALFFAYFSFWLCQRMFGKYIGDNVQFLIVIVFTLLVHSVSLAGVLGAKMSDLRQYKKWEPYHDALRNIEYNERVGIVRNRERYAEDEEFLSSVFGRYYKIIPTNSQLSKSFRNYFVFSDLPFTPAIMQEYRIKVILGVSNSLPEQ